MKSQSARLSLFALSLVFLAILGCSNPLGRFTKQYKCQLPGKPDPKTAYEFVERGMEHVHAEQFDCALGACSEAIRLDSRLATAYACRGGVLSNTGEFLKALKEFDQALNLQPNNGDFFYSRAQVHDRLGNINQALIDLDKATELIESEFGRSVAFALRARIYEKSGRLDDGITDYTQAIRLAPDFAYHHANRGDLYFEKKEFEKAVVDYSEAIRLDPNNKYFLQDRAKAYHALGREDLAAADEQDQASAQSSGRTISAGDITNEAINLPRPPYPAIAKTAHASGTVVVQVIVDERGSVMSAHAVSGHPLLQAVSVAAARGATFKPRLVSGKTVKVKGTIRYEFSGSG
jgi:TonB family protein